MAIIIILYLYYDGWCWQAYKNRKTSPAYIKKYEIKIILLKRKYSLKGMCEGKPRRKYLVWRSEENKRQ